MANEEVLGPRKTMFVLVIVVGCFAVLWPRILSPLLVGHQRDQLQPNQFDRDAGCCDVMFGSQLNVLELIDEVCSSAVHVNGKLSSIAAAECRKAVNETCGVDIAAFLKRSDNIGKSSRILVQTMQSSNSSCLKEHFGVWLGSLGPHPAINAWTQQDTIKQERPPIRGAGPHPALRERGRAIPAGAPPAAPQAHIKMPPNIRVRTSPLQGYYELDIKPPPIPGMRPPLGSPGGPVPAPKSSMGFVMPVYTICIIVFFVYTISKLFFKRATIPYEPVTPDPQFRRRVFRDDSRSSPDKLVVTAISGLVAEVQQQMEAGYALNQQRQDVQDNARPYTNGTIIHNSGPVHIIASQYEKDESPEYKPSPDDKQHSPDRSKVGLQEVLEEPESVKEHRADIVLEKDQGLDEVQEEDNVWEHDTDNKTPNQKENEHDKVIVDTDNIIKEAESKASDTEEFDTKESIQDKQTERHTTENKEKESSPEDNESTPDHEVADLVNLTEPVDIKRNGDIRTEVEDFLKEEVKSVERIQDEKTKELLEEAIDEEDQDDIEQEKSSVKVMGMETRAHAADGAPAPLPAPAPHAAPQPPKTPHEAPEVTSIFLESAIPQQSRVLVAHCEDRPDTRPHTHSPMVVSGKMTLSLIQDARDTPDRDLESTMDEFTTASAITQPAEKEGSDSEEEVEEEEIEIEEIEEEVEEEEELEEDEEEEEEKPKTKELAK